MSKVLSMSKFDTYVVDTCQNFLNCQCQSITLTLTGMSLFRHCQCQVNPYLTIFDFFPVTGQKQTYTHIQKLLSILLQQKWFLNGWKHLKQFFVKGLILWIRGADTYWYVISHHPSQQCWQHIKLPVLGSRFNRWARFVQLSPKYFWAWPGTSVSLRFVGSTRISIVLP